MSIHESTPRSTDVGDESVEMPVVVEVTGLASSGEGVGRLATGQVVFVDGGVPGDRVELADLSDGKKLLRGRIGRVLEASPDRVEPRCRHFGSCGGCRWQHVNYASQLEAKRSIVRDALKRIGGIAPEAIPGGRVEIVASPEAYGYRARARLVETQGAIGYRERSSHVSVAIEECPVLVPEAEAALVQLASRVGAAARDPVAKDPADRPKRRRAAPEWLVTAGSQGPAITQRSGRGESVLAREFVSIDVLGETLRAGSGSFI